MRRRVTWKILGPLFLQTNRQNNFWASDRGGLVNFCEPVRFVFESPLLIIHVSGMKQYKEEYHLLTEDMIPADLEHLINRRVRVWRGWRPG